uniref:Autophagy-related protein 27 n=1 Tax=Moniliophthora roreri TaxID=221103 RepID=A0A0W0FSQ8_MONRR
MSLKALAYLLGSSLILYSLAEPQLLYESVDGLEPPSDCTIIDGNSIYDLCPVMQDSRFIMKFGNRGLDHEIREAHSALIEFVCDFQADSNSAPSYTGMRDDIHSFRWTSRHACLINNDPSFSALEGEDAEDPNDKEENDNLLDTPSSPRVSRTRAALTVLIIGIAFLSTCYFIYNPPTYLIDTYLRPSLSRLSSGVSRLNFSMVPHHIKGLNLNPMSKKSRRRARSQFRVGENRLVQWAQEDMGLQGDMDTMVNASEDDEALLDEYIPLSVGMGWNGRRPAARDYGTARFAR